ncbi:MULTISPECIES: sporulation protein YabP [Paenisporosarcina]|uniref:Sporulation protein YabP n=1 Tax=Paenisporosarcina antarctica TaxID=417367 RepID=A0A4P7A278_9BACL|nr:MULTISPECIES: sporulation protein YabP [Paenisporosarcina]QBP42982.1 sporulation protein YabP [Paenisporosarcina antarctica]
MQYQAEHASMAIPSGDHVISLRNRKRMDLTSVKSIERFDQEEFAVLTSQGHLSIKGDELRIVHLDVDKGLLTLEGNVRTFQYDEEEREPNRNFLHKLFG